MKGTKSRKIYKSEPIKNFRELLERVEEKYSNNIAFKYKKDATVKEPEYIEKTYAQYIKDIKALSTNLLSLGYKGKKVAVIGNNRYEWCTTYMAVTTGGMIIVPLDKALPNNEIENLVKRSGAEVVIFDKKYMDVMLKIKENKENAVNRLICMDNEEIDGVDKYNDILNDGYKL